jgi:glycosyltransferase involved in cell wall biosynthesis
MKIGIDLRTSSTGGLGRGLVTYAVNLVQNLIALDQENQYHLFIAKNHPVNPWLEDLQALKHVTISRLQRPTRTILFWDQLCWYPLLKRKQINVFHSLMYGVPLLCPCQRILTIQDLGAFAVPECVPKFRHQAVYRFNFFTAKYADQIITPSQHTKQEVMQYLHIPEQRITVIPDGVAEQYRVIQDTQTIERLRARYRLPGKYLLYVGGFDKNKNLDILIRAFQLLVQEQSLPNKVLLVIVGNLSQQANALRALVNTCHLTDRVIFTGFVPEEDLIGIYNGAALFVFPSWYEGFGLPPLEAMACGVPVITSHAASLPEVVGDAAIQVNPYSPEELYHAIKQGLINPELRENMRRKGLARAKLLSWEDTARNTLKVYEEVYKERRGLY